MQVLAPLIAKGGQLQKKNAPQHGKNLLGGSVEGVFTTFCPFSNPLQLRHMLTIGLHHKFSMREGRGS